jgi:hypothetical protein
MRFIWLKHMLIKSFLEFIQWCIIVLSFVSFWYVSSSTGSCSSKLCKLLICLWKYWFLIVICPLRLMIYSPDDGINHEYYFYLLSWYRMHQETRHLKHSLGKSSQALRLSPRAAKTMSLDFRIKTMFSSFLPPVVCGSAHVLFALFVFACM